MRPFSLETKIVKPPLHDKKAMEILATEYSVSKVSIPNKVGEHRKECHSDVRAKTHIKLMEEVCKLHKKKPSKKLLGFLYFSPLNSLYT